MWVFTETGFVSAVVSLHNREQFIVRARDRQSLESISEMADVAIHATPERDYPFRVFVTRDQFAEWMSVAMATMEYNNFKSRVTVTRGADFVDALHSVWSVMHRVSPKDGFYDRYGVMDYGDYDYDSRGHLTRSARRRQWWEDLGLPEEDEPLTDDERAFLENLDDADLRLYTVPTPAKNAKTKQKPAYRNNSRGKRRR